MGNFDSPDWEKRMTTGRIHVSLLQLIIFLSAHASRHTHELFPTMTPTFFESLIEYINIHVL